MLAVILAGGQGTRLRPYTTTIPKPLVPVGNRAILEIVLERLRDAGVSDVRMAVNHMAELIMAFFGVLILILVYRFVPQRVRAN